jgi:dTDP-4-dehydrorhamnose 3,5-epimerase-like enzyme
MDQIKIITGGVSVDDRGSVRFVNDFNFDTVKRFYQVENHSAGFIRAWHGHKHEGKYIYVVKGSALVGAVSLDTIIDIKENSLSVIPDIYKTVLSAVNPRILFIPPGYANGFKTLEQGTIVQFFSTSTLEESIKDDVRFDYDIVNIWKDEYR